MKTVFLTLLILFGFATSAEATTYVVQGSADGPMYFDVNTDKSQYMPGESVGATTYIYAGATNVSAASLAGGTNGGWANIIGAQAISQGAHLFGSANIGTAPSSAGTYAANFTGGIELVEPPTPTTMPLYFNGGACDPYMEAYIPSPLPQTITVRGSIEYMTAPGGDWQSTIRDLAQTSFDLVIPAGQTTSEVQQQYDPNCLYATGYMSIDSVTPNPVGTVTLTY